MHTSVSVLRRAARPLGLLAAFLALPLLAACRAVDAGHAGPVGTYVLHNYGVFTDEVTAEGELPVLIGEADGGVLMLRVATLAIQADGTYEEAYVIDLMSADGTQVHDTFVDVGTGTWTRAQRTLTFTAGTKPALFGDSIHTWQGRIGDPIGFYTFIVHRWAHEFPEARLFYRR